MVFLQFFSFFNEFNSIYFELKITFLSHADVAADVAQAKMQCHMATYENAMWRNVCMAAYACVCARVCTSVGVCE